MVVTRKAVGCLFVLACCGGDEATHAPDTSVASETAVADTVEETAATETTDETTPDVEADIEEVDAVTPVTCDDPRVWSSGPYGVHRGDVADDFEVPLVDGNTWSFAQAFTGCDVVVVVPDSLVFSSIDSTTLWEDDIGLAMLLDQSPRDTIYLFVANTAEETAGPHVSAMQTRIDAELAGRDDADWWRPRLVVASARAQDLTDWVGAAMLAHLRTGFAIDREQRIHGLGLLSDVGRRDDRITEGWPWKSNLGYAAYEAAYLQAEGARQVSLDAGHATGTVVTLWDNELLAEYADRSVEMPDAATMATFDTLEIEVVSHCPNADDIEFGNCGAWDYLAGLYMKNGDGEDYTELARAITTYHREARWVIDASAFLPLLATGGFREFRWSFAPSWNTQPTSTTLRMHFSDRGKGMRPVRVTELFEGGAFTSTYNATREPKVVPIGAATKKVELWAVVTGHGSGTNQCAEFCAHQHHFSVGTSVYDLLFPEAGTDEGCIARVTDGMTPNQGGTWWFGRGGWCPGAPVAPWIVDVTADVSAGSDATLTYRGTLAGEEPPSGAGDIVMTSFLVEYE